MNENFDKLSQDQRDVLAREIKEKRQERDEVRAEAFESEEDKLGNIIKNILYRESGSSALHKKADRLNVDAKEVLKNAKERLLGIEIIDENNPQNVLSDKSRKIPLHLQFGSSPYSTEGFAENPERQSRLAAFLMKRLDLRDRGPSLDVGFGSNIHISNFFSSQGIKAFAMDTLMNSESGTQSLSKIPKAIKTNEMGVTIVSGDIAEVGKADSDLKDKKFGTILFNGSWTAGGNNFTVAGEVMEGKYHERKEKEETLVEWMDHEKDRILRECKAHLTSQGVVGVVSSRYAFHGAGYGYSRLPEEKLSFVDLYDRLKRMGAKKFYIFGITQEGFDEILDTSVDSHPETERKFLISEEVIKSTRERLRQIENLSPDDDVYSKFGDNPEYQKHKNQVTIQNAKNTPELNKLARIDALFAEF